MIRIVFVVSERDGAILYTGKEDKMTELSREVILKNKWRQMKYNWTYDHYCSIFLRKKEEDKKTKRQKQQQFLYYFRVVSAVARWLLCFSVKLVSDMSLILHSTILNSICYGCLSAR